MLQFTTKLNDLIWSKPMLFLILGAGIFFTIATRAVQFRKIKDMFHIMIDGKKSETGVSSVQAFMISAAGRVGTGNIAGVATAITFGGPGAIFWMWVVALIGGATSFVECTLAQIYKVRSTDGSEFRGGPSYYMSKGLGWRWLAVVFSAVALFATTFCLHLPNISTLVDSVESAYHVPRFATTLIVAAAFAAIVFGGVKRIGAWAEKMVPLMSLIYVAACLIIIVLHISQLPAAIVLVFKCAFNLEAGFGSVAGLAVMWGIKRGLYSNEAGMGSAPNAAATADVSHPAKQGLVQMLSVFIDTLLICSATAFMCLCSGVVPTPEAAGAAYVQASVQQSLGNFGPIFIAVSMCLFAFTTLIGNYYYCEGCLKYILKRDPSKAGMTVFRVLASLIVFVGATVSAGLAWDTADMLQATMVIINVPVILILGNKGVAVLKDYMRQRSEGKDPQFHAADIGITGTDFWN